MTKIDMHMHSFLSFDSEEDIKAYVNKALEYGLDGICLTEHDRWNIQEHEEPSYSRAEAYAKDSGIILLRNTELTTDYGHILVYGVPDEMGFVDELIANNSIPWEKQYSEEIRKYVPLDIILNEADKRGYVLAPAHPFRSSGILEKGYTERKAKGELNLFQWAAEVREMFEVMECYNGIDFPNNRNIMANTKSICDKFKFKQLGGSDSHNREMFGTCYTEFDCEINDEESLITALKNKDFTPIFNENWTSKSRQGQSLQTNYLVNQ